VLVFHGSSINNLWQIPSLLNGGSMLRFLMCVLLLPALLLPPGVCLGHCGAFHQGNTPTNDSCASEGQHHQHQDRAPTNHDDQHGPTCLLVSGPATFYAANPSDTALGLWFTTTFLSSAFSKSNPSPTTAWPEAALGLGESQPLYLKLHTLRI
jgi:hypothetical protein